MPGLASPNDKGSSSRAIVHTVVALVVVVVVVVLVRVVVVVGLVVVVVVVVVAAVVVVVAVDVVVVSLPQGRTVLLEVSRFSTLKAPLRRFPCLL